MSFALAFCLAGWPYRVDAQELALGSSEVTLISEIGSAVPALLVEPPGQAGLPIRLDSGGAVRSRGGSTLERWGPPEAVESEPVGSARVETAAETVVSRTVELAVVESNRPVIAPEDVATAGRLTQPDDSPQSPDLRQFSLYPVPWVEATGWEKALVLYEDTLFERSPLKLEDWALFRGEISVESPPDFVGSFYQPRPFSYFTARGNKLSRKLKRLARKKVHQEVRRSVKRRWRRQYRDSYMSYAQYRANMVRIRNIGKDPDEVDELDLDFNTDEVREDLFQQQYRDGERELPLLTWGPFTVTDAGSMYFDLGGVDDETESIDIGQEREERKPFLATKDYRLDTRFQFDVKPERLFSNDLVSLVRSYGITVEVDWLSDVLGRETIGAELQLEVDDHSEVAGFFNFVIKSR